MFGLIRLQGREEPLLSDELLHRFEQEDEHLEGALGGQHGQHGLCLRVKLLHQGAVFLCIKQALNAQADGDGDLDQEPVPMVQVLVP